MFRRIAVLLIALTFVLSAKAFAEDKAPKQAKPAKQPRVTETRLHEADMERIERSISKAVMVKQGTGVWEYTAKKMKPPKNDKWMIIWNDMGKEGWEAVDHFENVYIFKRPAYMTSSVKKEEPVVSEKEMKKEDKAKEEAMKEEDRAKEKAAKEAEKAAKKAQKEADAAAKKAQKEADKAAKKAAKEAEKAAKSAQ